VPCTAAHCTRRAEIGTEITILEAVGTPSTDTLGSYLHSSQTRPVRHTAREQLFGASDSTPQQFDRGKTKRRRFRSFDARMSVWLVNVLHGPELAVMVRTGDDRQHGSGAKLGAAHDKHHREAGLQAPRRLTKR
jgi:hypothetical protein